MIELTDDDRKVKPVTEYSTAKYYGVSFTGTRTRGFIAHSDSGFRVNYVEGLTMGSYHMRLTARSLLGVMREILGNGNKVYEFDTPKELFTWLTE